MFALTGRFFQVLASLGLGRALPAGRQVVTQNGVSGRVFSLAQITDSRFAGVIRALIVGAGIANVADFFIPDSLLGTLNLDDVGQGFSNIFGNEGKGDHPKKVTKTWHNGKDGDRSKATAFFVMLEDGRIGAQRKDGTWRYYLPKKPAGVVYSNGVAGDMRDFEKVGRAVTKQAKSIKKTINQLVPDRKPTSRRSNPAPSGARIVKEEGKGDILIVPN